MPGFDCDTPLYLPPVSTIFYAVKSRKAQITQNTIKKNIKLIINDILFVLLKNLANDLRFDIIDVGQVSLKMPLLVFSPLSERQL